MALVLAGVVLVRPGPVADWLGGRADAPAPPAQRPEPDPSPVLAAAAGDAPMPDPAAISAALDKALAGTVVKDARVSVLDIATGRSLYGRDPDTLTVPASTTKVLTAVAVLAARGAAHRIPTRAVAGAEPGEVVLVGGGDPTLSVDGSGYYAGAARLDQLASQVKAKLGATPTKVIVDSSLFSGPVHEPGWDDDVPTGGFAAPITALMTDGARIDPKQTRAAERYAKPDVAAGQAFARALGLPAEAVRAVSRGTAPAPTGAPTAEASGAAAPVAGGGGGTVQPGVELGRVESPPLVRLVEFMLNDSDNVVAEALARQVALARQQPASFTGAATAMTSVLGELGVPADKIRLADGSGLSRDNRITPSVLTSLLALAADGRRPELAAIFNGLPVAAWSGTLEERFRSPAAGAGAVRAKTGTLSGVNALAGVITTADGRILAFAALADRVPAGPEVAQPALDRIAATLAACGCR